MKKSELACEVATRASLSRAQADSAVNGVFSAIGEALANGESVVIAGFGTFATKTRAARQGRLFRVRNKTDSRVREEPAHRGAGGEACEARSAFQAGQGAS